MNIIKLREKTLADIEVNENIIKISYNGSEKEFDLAEYQEDIARNIDIVEENGDWGIGKVGENCKYIASILIPAKEYEMKPTEEVDQDGDPVFEQVQVENIDKTEIRLY